MKHPLISLADFTSLRRQLPAAAMGELVRRIEKGFRASPGLGQLPDDAVIVACLNPKGPTEGERTRLKLAAVDHQTEAERMGLGVIRACIGYREADKDSKGLWLNHLAVALAAADPVRVSGAKLLADKSRGGKETAKDRQEEAKLEEERLRKVVKQKLATDGPMKNAELAEWLAEREGLGYYALLKKMPRLRPSSK